MCPYCVTNELQLCLQWARGQIQGRGVCVENFSGSEPDELLTALARVEAKLQEWIRVSDSNLQWFIEDPLAAMAAAGLDLEQAILRELQLVAEGIALKLKAA